VGRETTRPGRTGTGTPRSPASASGKDHRIGAIPGYSLTRCFGEVANRRLNQKGPLSMSNRVHAATNPLSASLGPQPLWPVGVLTAGGLLGLVAGINPLLALAAIVAAVIVPVVVAKPIFGLCTLVFLSFLESFSGVTPSLSLTKIVGLLLVLGWIGTLATASPADRARRSLFTQEPVLAASLVLFAAWAAVSLVWAERPAEGASSLSRFALNFVLFPIALAAVRVPRHVLALFAVFIAGALVSAVYGMLSPGAAADVATGRLSGVGLNPNQLGQLLVVAIVLAGTFATNRRWPGVLRLAALAAALVAAAGLYMTLSRGAVVGLLVALLVAPFAVGRGRRAGTLVLVTAALLVSVGWFAAFAPEGAAERITHPEREGGSGREELWRLSWRIVEDHPIRGVGAGNFPVSSVHYVLRPGRSDQDQYIVDTPKVPHNIYLEVLSELGIVGLTLFAVILISSLRCALLAAHEFARRKEPMMELLARGLFISLVGLLAAEFFSSQLFSKQLWLLLATAPALLAVARRGMETAPHVTPLTRPQSPVRVRATG
jgi:O-antigen ligase